MGLQIESKFLYQCLSLYQLIFLPGTNAAAAGRVQHCAPGPGGAHLQPPEQPPEIPRAHDEVVTRPPAYIKK